MEYRRGGDSRSGQDGHPIWYGGGKLAADLTLPKLRTDGLGRRRVILSPAWTISRAAVRAVLRATVARTRHQ